MSLRNLAFLLLPPLLVFFVLTMKHHAPTATPITTTHITTTDSGDLSTKHHALDALPSPITAKSTTDSNSFSAQPHVVSGIVDGDTFYLSGVAVSIRLWGIDAPEKRQKCYSKTDFWMCGEEATKFLSEQILGKAISCTQIDESFKRIVAKCLLLDADLAALMVQNGWAVDWPKFSQGQYSKYELAAHSNHLGIYRE